MLPDLLPLSDKVTLVKQDGTTIEDIPADVQSKTIFINDASLPIEEGDVLVRDLPNGLCERFVVVERGYFSASAGFPAHYQVKFSRQRDQPSAAETTTVYNLHGDNARVNVNSTDSSINVVSVRSNQMFADLRAAVQNIDGAEQAALLRHVDQMEKEQGTNSFAKRYAEFMALAANHASVLSPFFPALGQLLAS